MKKRTIYITLILISIMFLSIGGAFALVTNIIIGTNITQIKSGDLTMTISGGGSINSSFVPTKCTSENAIKKTIKVTAVNTSGGSVSFSVGLDIISISDTFKRSTMRYILTTSANGCSTDIVAGGSFKDRNAGDEVWLIKNDYDNIAKSGNNYTKTYYLYIWLDETETEYIEGNISVKLKGTTSNEPNLSINAGYDDESATDTLYYKIKSNANKITRVDFNNSNSSGIYTTTNTNNGIPVYYYRGKADNNVIFANFCWKIIRTTETGGVKLIYNGVPFNGQCSNTGVDTTIGNSTYNAKISSPAYVGYMYNTDYEASNNDITTLNGTIIFGNDVIYDESTNKYTLKDIYTLTNSSNWSSEYTTIANKYHYTCFTSNNSCTNVNYIHAIYSSDKKVYYFTLSNGKKIADILNEMLGVDSNVKNSTIKTIIDTWYQNNMTGYTSQLEDTVFCNDRTYYNYNVSGWNKDYNNYDRWLFFSTYYRIRNKKPTLVCPRLIDMFTVNNDNGNGALIYPVGLITYDEVLYAGETSNASFYLYNDMLNWTMSPSNFSTWYALNYDMYYSNKNIYAGVTNSYGVRPSISLKSGTTYSGGDGTSSLPYIINWE